MPRRADVTCAGACGRLIWRGTGSRPPGQAMCRACRQTDHIRVCVRCGDEFKGQRGAHAAKRCPACRALKAQPAGPKPRSCVCGTVLTGTRLLTCDPCKAANRSTKRRRYKLRKRGAHHEHYTLPEIAARDRHSCGICRRRVDMALVVPHPGAPTIDHLVPISEGGDDVKANVRLAHFVCNSKRGTGGTVQLLLVG